MGQRLPTRCHAPRTDPDPESVGRPAFTGIRSQAVRHVPVDGGQRRKVCGYTPRGLRTQDRSTLPTMALRLSDFGSNHQPRPVGNSHGLAGIGAGRLTPRRVRRFPRWDREALERNRDCVAVAPMLDDRGTLLDTDEPGAPASVHHRLIRLKGTGRPETELQELCAGDRVQAERVHARKFGGTRARPARSCAWTRPKRPRVGSSGGQGSSSVWRASALGDSQALPRGERKREWERTS
jgi:hypothetical protein